MTTGNRPRSFATASRLFVAAAVAGAGGLARAQSVDPATRVVADAGAPPSQVDGAAHDVRMAWWRDARFGMFIHWGLYAIPGGEWNGKTSYGEWIRHEAKIPLEEYTKLQPRFEAKAFDARAIARAAREAGMKYIVITSKHHDGFCLFRSDHTDWDVAGTPWGEAGDQGGRDILEEVADACRAEGLKLGWYYSIMDWHHPDYLPRRDWEDARSTKGADFDRYMTYMKRHLTELLTRYGDIAVLWFDGQWEGSWTDERGRELEAHVRGLQPGIIINSRVGRSGGSWGLEGGRLGDYSTPEQFIPERAPGGDWETCMTMNGHWGYNAADKMFKSSDDLVRKLIDIVSKGGNFLLNIGPDANGRIPPESVDRLATMGRWMQRHGPAIHGASASPLWDTPGWGRCTMKRMGDSTRLYLHVFDWPADGKVVVPGLYNAPAGARVMGAAGAPALSAEQRGDDVVVDVGGVTERDALVTVIELDIAGDADAAAPARVTIGGEPLTGKPVLFLESQEVELASPKPGAVVRYTLDGSDPTPSSPAGTKVRVEQSATLAARLFRSGRAVGPVVKAQVAKTALRGAAKVVGAKPGLSYAYFELPGDIAKLEDMTRLAPVATGVCEAFDLGLRKREKHWGVRYRGYISVPEEGVYRFTTGSDDGSRLWIGEELVVENDTPHSYAEETGSIALAPGLHPITVEFFENWGGYDLKVFWSRCGMARQAIPRERLFRDGGAER